LGTSGITGNLRYRQKGWVGCHSGSLDIRKAARLHEDPGCFNQARKRTIRLLLKKSLSLYRQARRNPVEVVDEAIDCVETDHMDAFAFPKPAPCAYEYECPVNSSVCAIAVVGQEIPTVGGHLVEVGLINPRLAFELEDQDTSTREKYDVGPSKFHWQFVF